MRPMDFAMPPYGGAPNPCEKIQNLRPWTKFMFSYSMGGGNQGRAECRCSCLNPDQHQRHFSFSKQQTGPENLGSEPDQHQRHLNFALDKTWPQRGLSLPSTWPLALRSHGIDTCCEPTSAPRDDILLGRSLTHVRCCINVASLSLFLCARR